MFLPKSSLATSLHHAPSKAAKHGNNANCHRHEEAKPSVLHEPKRTVSLKASASDHHLEGKRKHRPNDECRAKRDEGNAGALPSRCTALLFRLGCTHEMSCQSSSSIHGALHERHFGFANAGQRPGTVFLLGEQL